MQRSCGILQPERPSSMNPSITPIIAGRFVRVHKRQSNPFFCLIQHPLAHDEHGRVEQGVPSACLGGSPPPLTRRQRWEISELMERRIRTNPIRLSSGKTASVMIGRTFVSDIKKCIPVTPSIKLPRLFRQTLATWSDRTRSNRHHPQSSNSSRRALFSSRERSTTELGSNPLPAARIRSVQPAGVPS